MCSWKVMWEINKIISPLSQCLCSEDLLAWWHTTRSSRPYIWVNLQWNTLYMHLQMIRGYQTRQGANLQWEVPTIIGIWPFYHVTNVRSLDSFKNLYFHYARLMVSKSGRVLTYGRGGLARKRLSFHHVLVAFAWNAKSFAIVFPFSLIFFLLSLFLDGLINIRAAWDMPCAFKSCALDRGKQYWWV